MAMDRRQQEQLIADIIRTLGTSLKNRGLYPATHPLVRKPVEKCFSDLVPFFGDRQELALMISDGTLVFEGVPLFSLTSSLEHLMDRLVKIGVPAIIFEKELRIQDLENFVRFLHETKDAELTLARIKERMDDYGVRHIRVRETEDDKEDDLLLAREIYGNATDVLTTVIEEVRQGRIPSGAESERVVRDISSMLKRNRDAMLALTLIKNFDEYTYNHSVNVAVLSLALADALALPEAEKIEVGVAGLLHDVGKTQLALDLIRKPGGLTDSEFEEIKKHPEEGYVLLGRMSHIRPASAYMVLEHHMRFDRKGYPGRGHDYRRYSNSHIVPVADTYDALTTMRSYQKARSPLDALETMKRLASRSLSPDHVALLTKTLGAYPIGTMVRLSTMEIGVVTATGPGGQGPSRLALVTDRNGIALARPEPVDLTRITGRASLGRRSIVATVNPLFHPPAAADSLLRATTM